jgi:hypothetical protein
VTDIGAYIIETQNLTKKYNSFLAVDGLNLAPRYFCVGAKIGNQGFPPS